MTHVLGAIIVTKVFSRVYSMKHHQEVDHNIPVMNTQQNIVCHMCGTNVASDAFSKHMNTCNKNFSFKVS